MSYKRLAVKIVLSLCVFSCAVISSGQALEKPRDQGIGGTGIIGIITGFGSIFVNGYEVDYTPSQVVESNFDKAATPTLQRGQVVRIVAHGEGMHLLAESLAVEHEIVGPIATVDKSHKQIMVLNQLIDIQNIKDVSMINAGEWVAVSGFRDRNGKVRASLIEPVAAGAVQIIGNIKELKAYTKDIGGLRLTAQQRAGRLILSGFMKDGRVMIARIKPWAFFSGKQNLTRISLEGFFNTVVGSKVDPTKPEFLADVGKAKTALSSAKNMAVSIINASVGGGGLFKVEAILPMPSISSDSTDKSDETGETPNSSELLNGLTPTVNDVTNSVNQNVRSLPGSGGIIHNAPSIKSVK